MSLRRMALLAGRDRGYLSCLERGLVGATPETLRRIADALDVPLPAINREELT